MFALLTLCPCLLQIPFNYFVISTAIGLQPTNIVFVQAGASLGSLHSWKDLYGPRSIMLLTLCLVATLLPVLVRRHWLKVTPGEALVHLCLHLLLRSCCLMTPYTRHLRMKPCFEAPSLRVHCLTIRPGDPLFVFAIRKHKCSAYHRVLHDNGKPSVCVGCVVSQEDNVAENFHGVLPSVKPCLLRCTPQCMPGSGQRVSSFTREAYLNGKGLCVSTNQTSVVEEGQALKCLMSNH